VQILSRYPQLHAHFRQIYASTNEATHLKLDYQKHLKIAADCTKVLRLRTGQEYHLPPRSHLHVLLQGTIC
jgi:hypothetical protein